VAEPDQFALHAPVPRHGILSRQADHELADRSCSGRPSGTPAAAVVPFACHQLSVPGEQRRRRHREHLRPPPPRDQLRQRSEPQPVARLVADPAGLAAQHRVLVPEHQQFGVLGHLTPGQHRSPRRTGSVQGSRRLRRSFRDDPSPEDSASQAGSSNRGSQDLPGGVRCSFARSRLLRDACVISPCFGRFDRRCCCCWELLCCRGG
jgi:hypothetical protein